MLANTAMLVEVRFRRIATARKDRQITSTVLSAQHASDRSGHWTTKLWPEEALSKIIQIDNRIRTYYHDKTLPWLNNGQRILAARIFTDFAATMRGYRYEREEAVRGFLDDYELWVDRARQSRGDLFDERAYPNRARATRRFGFNFEVMPLPSAEDFRVTLRDSELTQLQDELAARLEAAETAAKRELFARIAAPVADLLTKLSDPDAKLTEATFSAVRGIAAAIPEINLWDDPAIDALRLQLAGLTDLHAEHLKESRSDRTRAAAKASTILATMAPWMTQEDAEGDPADLDDIAA